MFKSMMDMETGVSVLVIGVGTVGCRITASIKDTINVDKLYVHSSPEVLNQYAQGSVHSDSLHLSEQVFFLEQEIIGKLEERDIVFVVAGLGGETGSVVAPYITKLIKQRSILCVGLCSFPFEFEGRYKKKRSQQAYLSMAEYTDSLICIDNDRFLDSNLKNNELQTASDIFQDSNNHFEAVIKGLSGLLTQPGMINVDIEDIRTIFNDMGLATVGYGVDRGDQRSADAVANLLNSPALGSYPLSEAKGCLVNITAGLDMRLDEFEVVGNAVKDILGYDATVVIGTSFEPDMTDTMTVTVIITGLPELPIDKSIAQDLFDMVTLSKSIAFEPHQASAGLSILSYFNEFLHQQYSGIEAKVSIRQEDTKITLIVETASGEVEKVEKSLYEFGLVVIKEKSPSDVLHSNFDVEKFKMKLEFAELELKQNARLIANYEVLTGEYKQRITSLEDRVGELQKVICESLVTSQELQKLQLSRNDQLPLELVSLLKEHGYSEMTQDVKDAIELKVRREITTPEQASKLKTLALNTFYGVAGNSMYTLLTNILATLPR
ncbi:MULTISPECIES: cell division protein FtsZ [Vibrio]|uniref:cell division protein FtsZ n=1 Tax=Vibrio TaxID=662 RepID=UPI001BD6622F|nr:MULTISPECIES: cell division protein FtsZ [Vibrio]ELA8348547.1 cell division FtsZ family protein [Vibrio alginolyticus]ELA8468277.1 cell division FtsZ family protein [Vibrio alginolyticus]ELH9640327.1 cell division FtsZ family protein [Vibrio alginolyticus]MBS9869598.1 cell division FtsZ family protein [Vibrio alginolyticus]MBS9963166.1 cell division FtsZ family protein [Vibrio alginolyticus]